MILGAGASLVNYDLKKIVKKKKFESKIALRKGFNFTMETQKSLDDNLNFPKNYLNMYADKVCGYKYVKVS